MSREELRVGVVYETLDAYERRPGDPLDHAVEYEPESTIVVLEQALRQLGHDPVRIGTPHALLAAIGRGDVAQLDAALSIAEGFGSRNREAWAPVLLEMAGIPLLGSDALTLSLTLDKVWTNQRVAAIGIPVPAGRLFRRPEEVRSGELPGAFPLFVKPRWEGTSKGIRRSSLVTSREQLAVEVERVTTAYRQPALVEVFVPGAEYTVTVVGNDPARALPVLQRALDAQTGIGLHAIAGVHGELRESSSGTPGHELDYDLPGDLDAGLEERLQALALAVYTHFECLDFARVDFRLDSRGEPVFLEINPLPTFAVDGSFGILAELQGRSPAEALAEVFGAGLRRLLSLDEAP